MKSLSPPTTSPTTFLEFKGSCLKQDKFTFVFVSFTKNIKLIV